MKNKLNILYIGKSAELISNLEIHHDISLILRDNLISALCYLKTERHPDAILCDSRVNGGDGLGFHKQLREHSEFDRVPFILMSDEFREDSMKKAFGSGVDDFFVIPVISAESLIERIRFLKEFRETEHRNSPRIPEGRHYRMPVSKRLFDIAMASSALVVFLPVLLIVMIAIRLESKGRVYYTSVRVGREPFTFYKLRSMRDGAEAELKKLAAEKNQYASEKKKSEINFEKPCPRCSELKSGETCSPLLHIGSHSICEYWYQAQKKEIARNKSSFIKIQDDPRITKVGKLIRNTSIDELPQLINVIKGEMSIVGNRPLPLYEAETLTYDHMAKRFLAPAGLTGLWQVIKRGKGGNMSEEERKALDNQYADIFIGDKYSFWYDLELIMKTIPAMFQKETV